jgi:hypothetical protein
MARHSFRTDQDTLAVVHNIHTCPRILSHLSAKYEPASQKVLLAKIAPTVALLRVDISLPIAPVDRVQTTNTRLGCPSLHIARQP